MNIVKEDLGDLSAVLKLSVSPEDYQGKVEAALKDLKKKASLPGFRPGKVPMGVIKKSHGKSVLADELNKLINDELYKYISENKLNILGNPLPKADGEQGDFNNPGDFEFAYEIGLAPEFEIKLSGRDKAIYHTVKISDKMIQDEVDNATRRFGNMSAPEVAEDKDMLVGEFTQLDENGDVLEGGVKNNSTISLEFVEDAKAKKALVGAKVGDTFKVDPKTVSKGENDMAAMLGVKPEELANLTGDFNFTVTEIKRLEPAELNEELFKKMFGENTEVKTEEDLKNKLKEDYAKFFNRDSDRLFKKTVSDKLIGKLKLTLPDEFLKRWIQASNEKEVTMEQVEQDYEQYSKQLQWQLIENKIITDKDIKVSHEDALNQTKELIKQQFAQNGLNMEWPDEELNKHAAQLLTNQEEAQKVYQSLYDEKITAYFKDTVKIEEQEVEYEDFVKLFYAN